MNLLDLQKRSVTTNAFRFASLLSILCKASN